MLERGLERFASRGLSPTDVRVHLGPAICGNCYEVGPEVIAAVTGEHVSDSRSLDLRAVLASRAREAGATVTMSDSCTKCHNETFFSHRAGDVGRQLGVLVVQG